ncbi:hypothetical protein, partial [Staphylococcus aureus]|uniref:hypothetical protein n=1 Tax=Staphylococcus aureus TaxID=1280 RepID=UPI0037DA3737
MCPEPRKLYFGLAHLMLYEQVRFCYILAYLHANYINVNVLAIFYRLIFTSLKEASSNMDLDTITS